MRMIALSGKRKETLVTDRFGGLNERNAGHDEFTAMKNLSPDGAGRPATREQRREYLVQEGVQGLTALEFPVYAAGGKVYYNGEEVSGLSVTEGEKQLVPVGSRVYIFPDKKWLEAEGGIRHGNLESSFSYDTGTLLITPGLKNYPDAQLVVSATEPTVTEPGDFEGKLWLDSGSVPCKLMKYLYDGAAGDFYEVTPDCVRIKLTGGNGSPPAGAFDGFGTGESITVSGTGAVGKALAWLGLDSDFVVLHKSDAGFILLNAKISGYKSMLLIGSEYTGALTLSKKLPSFDFAVYGAGRLWGCVISENRIYYSIKGHPDSFGGSTGSTNDAGTLDAGTPGPFTAAAVYMGAPVFFKEDSLQRAVGQSLVTLSGRGVMNGCRESVAFLAGALYYMSRDGICAYNGTEIQLISCMLDTGGCLSAAAGAYGDLYYISLTGAGGKGRLLVYDTVGRRWYAHDELSLKYTASACGVLYMYDGERLLTLGSALGDGETGLAWYSESGDFPVSGGGLKLLSRIIIRCSLSPGASLRVYVMYDNDGNYIFAGSGESGFVSLPVVPRRCDSLKIRLEGDGGFTLRSLVRVYGRADG